MKKEKKKGKKEEEKKKRKKEEERMKKKERKKQIKIRKNSMVNVFDITSLGCCLAETITSVYSAGQTLVCHTLTS